jgi:hypothetical protein
VARGLEPGATQRVHQADIHRLHFIGISIHFSLYSPIFPNRQDLENRDPSARWTFFDPAPPRFAEWKIRRLGSPIAAFAPVVSSYFSIFLLQDVMRFDPATEHLSRLKLKSKAVVHGHRTFPTIYCPGDPFDPKRRVMKIIEKKGKFLSKSFAEYPAACRGEFHL